jgi:hypothetical protein
MQVIQTSGGEDDGFIRACEGVSLSGELPVSLKTLPYRVSLDRGRSSDDVDPRESFPSVCRIYPDTDADADTPYLANCIFFSVLPPQGNIRPCMPSSHALAGAPVSQKLAVFVHRAETRLACGRPRTAWPGAPSGGMAVVVGERALELHEQATNGRDEVAIPRPE